MPQKINKQTSNENEERQEQNDVMGGTELDVSELREEEDPSSEEEGGLRIGDIYIPPPPKPVCSNEAVGPRLIITHIENENFKSYAGKQTLGPFHKVFMNPLRTFVCNIS
jgi:structural maintenance of chromosome 4